MKFSKRPPKLVLVNNVMMSLGALVMMVSAAFVSYSYFWNGGQTTEDRSDAAGRDGIPSVGTIPSSVILPSPFVTSDSPTLVTRELPAATVGKPYVGTVRVAMNKPFTTERMYMSGYVTGLEEGSCRTLPTQGSQYYYECDLIGTPQIGSLEPIIVYVSVMKDNQRVLADYTVMTVNVTTDRTARDQIQR